MAKPFSFRSRHLKIILVLFLVILAFALGNIIAPFWSRPTTSSSENTEYFKTVEKRVISESKSQREVLGTSELPVSIENSCIDQYNNGIRYWCESKIKQDIVIEPSIQYLTTLLKKLDPVVQSQGMKVIIPAGMNAQVDAVVYQAEAPTDYKSLTCTTTVIYNPNGNTPSAIKDPRALHCRYACQAPSNGLIPGYMIKKS